MSNIRVGTLIPHFGANASREGIVGLSRRAEELGYDSLWVRDHLVWEPHGMEGTNTTFIDPFITLAAAAAVTNDCRLGTAVAIPIRWPLKLAQEFASLDFIAPGRVVAGLGLGFNPAEFAAAGLDSRRRDQILEETVAILRQAWLEEVNFPGEVFPPLGVDLNPKPKQAIPILYGGTTPAGVRRAAELADGWYCGRLPIDTLRLRLTQLREAFNAKSKRPYTVVQPLVVVGDTYPEAAARVPIEEVAHSSEGARFWVSPPSGGFRTVEDLRGLVLCGTPEQIAEQCQDFVELGVDEVVLDFRLQFDETSSVLETIGRETLPRLTSP